MAAAAPGLERGTVGRMSAVVPGSNGTMPLAAAISHGRCSIAFSMAETSGPDEERVRIARSDGRTMWVRRSDVPAAPESLAWSPDDTRLAMFADSGSPYPAKLDVVPVR